MTAILTKSELAEILLVDGQYFKNNNQAIEELGEYYQKIINNMIKKTDSFFIRAFRNRNYDIKLLISSNNSKFIIS
jgi:hypothetical protein